MRATGSFEHPALRWLVPVVLAVGMIVLDAGRDWLLAQFTHLNGATPLLLAEPRHRCLYRSDGAA